MREINSLNFAEELKSPLWSRTWENPTDRLLSSIVLRRAQINSLWGSQKYVSIVLGMLIGMALIDLIQETETTGVLSDPAPSPPGLHMDGCAHASL